MRNVQLDCELTRIQSEGPVGHLVLEASQRDLPDLVADGLRSGEVLVAGLGVRSLLQTRDALLAGRQHLCSVLAKLHIALFYALVESL